MLRKILVTGGAGFIGAALTRHLVGAGHHVRVLDDMSRGTLRRLAGVRALVVQGDVRDEASVLEAADGCDAIVHLAAVQGTANFYAMPRAVLDVALRGTLNVVAACEKHHIADLLLVSSSEAYQVPPVLPAPEDVPLTVPDVLNPRYSYGGGKIASELLAAAAAREGITGRLLIARPHNVYGPDMGGGHIIDDFACRMRDLDAARPPGVIRFPVQGTGTETRSYCHVADCVRQLALLLERGDGIYNIGSDEERTTADVAEAIAACFGRRIEVVPGDLPAGSVTRRVPDLAKIRALGYEQQVSFADGIAQTVAWYRQEGSGS